MKENNYCIDLELLNDKQYKISLLKDEENRKFNSPQDYGYFAMNSFIYTFNNLLRENNLCNYTYEILENKEEVEYIITTYDISAWLNVVWNTVGLLDKGHQIGNDEEFEF